MSEPSSDGWIPRVAGAVLRTRWVVRAPIFVYKARLGGIFGKRLLMLEHTGRKSGRPRNVVLEIIDRPTDGGFVVVSGFGDAAQWYRNIQAHPGVRLYLGSHRPVDAIAMPLGPDEATASLRRYADNYPKAWAALRPVLENTLGSAINIDCTNLPMVLVTPS
ncbi:MAG TPA: nitroreductase family deazaflavin-dependent oxidoreductase [Galbitalea sp.]|jgi:deazaflavin-dependent oxidoreductase (nitroreductase family)